MNELDPPATRAEHQPCTVLRPEGLGEHDWQVALTGRCIAGAPSAPYTRRGRVLTWTLTPLLAAAGLVGAVAVAGPAAGPALIGLTAGALLPGAVRVGLGMRRDTRLSVQLQTPESVRLVARAQAALQSLDARTTTGFGYLRPAALQAYRELLDELVAADGLEASRGMYESAAEVLREGDPDRLAVEARAAEVEVALTSHHDRALERVAGLEALVKELTVIEREHSARALAGMITGRGVLEAAARQELAASSTSSLPDLTFELQALRKARTELSEQRFAPRSASGGER